MKTKGFNPNQLRVGDFVLIRLEGSQKPRAAEVIYAKAYSNIAVKLRNRDQHWFCSRKGFDDILAGARLVDGQWMPL